MAKTVLGAARDYKWLLLPWLLLAAIFAHALLPVGSPLFRSNGSAFSASTVDVSLAPSRKDRPSEAKRDEDAAKADFASGGPAKWASPAAEATQSSTASRADASRQPFHADIAGVMARGEARPFQARAPPTA
jgi:hypothetical protein